MPSAIVETAVIILRSGVSEADLVAASDRFQREFLNDRKGFLRRELLKLAEGGGHMDLIHWADEEAAEAVMAEAATSPACQAYFSIMEMDPANPNEGVRHYRSLAAYEA